jgi:gamma-glutamyltranspeptidase/glutathione hydrolase
MRLLAKNGPRDFYEGEVARMIVKDMAALGGVLDAEDLKNFHARIVAPLEVEYGGATVSLAGGLTGGQSMAGVLKTLAGQSFSKGGAPGADAFVAYAETLREAYAERLNNMGEASDQKSPGCTSHFNVIDREGNMVAVMVPMPARGS